MAKRSRKNHRSEVNLKDFVVVTVLDDLELAKEYETLLNVNDIPAMTKEQVDPSGSDGGIALMVPEDFLDEAHVVIESQDAYDDFYDFAIEDEEEGELDDNPFEDEF